MNLNTIIQLLQNKLGILQTARGQAYSVGDLNQLNTIDTEILETQNTLSQLGALSNIAVAASSVNASLTDVAASGINAVKNPDPIVQGPSASAVVNGYDISAYATDPQYEAKIQLILSRMPMFSVVSNIDNYIQAVAIGSPVTGDMVYKASQLYGVDLPLMLAIMQNDSAFGTLGVGAKTLNPGNIGNTGTSTQSYPSWTDGVTAVASWLNNHRVVTPTVDPATITPTPVTPDTTSTTTTATSTPTTTDSSTATTTPAAILPTTPVVAATSTIPFFIPTVNATTTPITTATSTIATATTTPDILTATSTPAIDTTTASSTPSTATTTPAVDLTASSTPVIDTTTASSTTASSTATTTDTVVIEPTATTTPPLDLTASSTAAVTNATTTTATSTPDVNASSTQARRITVKRLRV